MDIDLDDIDEDEIEALMDMLTKVYRQENSLVGKNVVITGKIWGWTRAELIAAIQEKGGTSPGSVTKDTVMLVVGDKPGQTKCAAAMKKGIDIVTPDQLMEMLKA